MNKYLLIFLLCLTLNFKSFAAGTLYSHGDPTNEEQLMLEFVNRARANPTAEGQRLANSGDPQIENSYAQHPEITKAQVIADFKTYPARPPLAFNRFLIDAARKHNAWMEKNGLNHFEGGATNSPSDRAQLAGYQGGAGENILYGYNNVWAAHCGWNIDFGVEGFGHRYNIMSYGANTMYYEIGIAYDTKNTGILNPVVSTEDFGTTNKSFVLGVVYRDDNGNNFYDLGEGVPNITITTSQGNFYAITSASGGYAIPIDGLSGTLVVTASGAGIGGTTNQSISLNGQSVKVDFTSLVPGAISLNMPLTNTVLNEPLTDFSWYKGNKVTKYWIEIASDDKFANILKSDQNLTDTNYHIDNLTNGQDYYWHVKGSTVSGWGEFSKTYKFSVKIRPSKVELLLPVDQGIVTSKTTTFTWNKSKGVVMTYQFQLWEEFGDTPFVIDSALTDTFKVVTGLQYGQNYYWYVFAKNTDYYSDKSDENTFSTVEANAPLPVKLSSPADNSKFTTDHIKFQWVQPAEKVSKYWIEVATDPNFKDIVHYDSTLTDYATVSKLFTFDTIGVYYWRVTAKNQYGWGQKNTPWKFELLGDGVDFEVANIKATVFPNPSQSKVTIVSNSTELLFKSFKVFSLTGELIYSNTINQDLNSNGIELDFGKQPQGNYLIELETNLGRLVRRIEITR